MVVDDSITNAINRVADNQEEMIDVLKKILAHYNAVVPSMKEGADRSNKYGRIADAEEMRENGMHN
jgi:hypothetical protein